MGRLVWVMRATGSAFGMLLAALAMSTPPADALRWSAPAAIDPPPATTARAITAMSCPSTSLCVAGDDAGDVLTSTSPSGGASGWHAIRDVDPPGAIAGISCPTAHLCVAAGADGHIATSTHPLSAWRLGPAIVLPTTGLTAVACPTTRFCVALDRAGHLFTSPRPTGRAWKRATAPSLPPHDWLTSISCPSRSLCIAVDALGQRVVHAAHGGRSWSTVALHAPKSDTLSPPSISCPTPKLCAIVGQDADLGNAFVARSTDPAGGAGAWKVARHVPAATGYLLSVSCPSVRLCVADGDPYSGPVVYTTDPAGGGDTWKKSYSPAPSGDGTTGIACPSVTMCVAYDSGGEVITTANPQLGSGWTTTAVDQVNELDAVDCVSATLCVAGGTGGRVLTSTDPAGAAAWTAATTGVSPTSIACPSSTLCVAAGDTGTGLEVSTNPTGGASAWTAVDADTLNPIGSNDFGELSCPSVSLCIVPDYTISDGGDLEVTYVLSSTNPAGGTAAWKLPTMGEIDGGVNGGRGPGDGRVTAVSCPSVSLCVGVDDGGRVLRSTNPAKPTTWTRSDMDGATPLTGIDCPTTSVCVASDANGDVVSSTTAFRTRANFVKLDPPGTALTAVSCASASFCVAVDGAHHAFVSTHPTGGPGAWKREGGIDGGLTALSCPSPSLCVAVDDAGNAIVGKR